MHDDVGKTSGFFKALDEAYLPEQVTATWQVANGAEGWKDAPAIGALLSPPALPPLDADGKYLDADFPAIPASIGASVKSPPDCWLRAPDFLPHTKLFDGIEPGDITQGHLGNCWLMAAFACVAEFPILIESLFREESATADGRYTVRLYDLSTKDWVALSIDDAIPCKWRHGNPVPCFTRPSGREMWTLLLEKAFAKLCGS